MAITSFLDASNGPGGRPRADHCLPWCLAAKAYPVISLEVEVVNCFVHRPRKPPEAFFPCPKQQSMVAIWIGYSRRDRDTADWNSNTFVSKIKIGIGNPEQYSHVGTQKRLSGIGMGGDALEQCQGVADPIRGMGGERGWSQQGVNRDNLLEQGRHGARRMPQNGSQIRKAFSFLGEL